MYELRGWIAQAIPAVWVALVVFQLSCGETSLLEQNTNDSNTVELEAPELAADGRPVGWTEATHGKTADADYAVVFPQDRVLRIDVTMTAASWQAMLEDMTANYGEFGTSNQGMGGGVGGDVGDTGANGGARAPGNIDPTVPVGGTDNGIPPEMLDVCDTLQEGDACTASFNGVEMEGTCTTGSDGQLICQPQMDGGAFPGNPGGGIPTDMPDFSDSCESLAEGDACTVLQNGTATQGTCATDTDSQLVCRTQEDPGSGNGVPGDGDVPNGGGAGGVVDDDTNPLLVPCKVVFEDKTWWYVGIRFKGFSSLTSTWNSGIYKLPFRFDFDAFDDDYPEVANQRFYGFEKLSLASNWSDSTYLREKVTHDVFREAGVPAPRTAFCRLYIDYGQGPIYFGLYALTEIPDQPMLEAQFGDDSGNLYKPTSTWASFDESDFDKETNKDEADFSDVQAAIAALNADRTDAAAWRAGLETTFNVDGFLRWLAVNTVIVNWDTYGQMAHNYYRYGNPQDAGRPNGIPWDNNMAFMDGMGGGQGAGGAIAGNGGLSLGLTEVQDQWPLIRYLLDDPTYQAAYVSHMRTFVEQVFDVATLQARFQAEHDLIAPYVVGEEGEQAGYTLLNSAEDFDTALTSLLQFVADRHDAAVEFLSTQP